MSDMKEKGITNRGPKKRDPACFQTVHPILIPAGTMLRQDPGKPGTFTCPAGYGVFSVSDEVGQEHPGTYRRVIG